MSAKPILTRNAFAAAVAGGLIGAFFNAYLLTTQQTIPFAPAAITAGTIVSSLSILWLMLAVLSKRYSTWLLIPIFFAGLAPSYCLLLLCFAGYLEDSQIRFLTYGLVSVCSGICVLLFADRHVGITKRKTPRALLRMAK